MILKFMKKPNAKEESRKQTPEQELFSDDVNVIEQLNECFKISKVEILKGMRT